jgi:hypothetical protein
VIQPANLENLPELFEFAGTNAVTVVHAIPVLNHLAHNVAPNTPGHHRDFIYP